MDEEDQAPVDGACGLFLCVYICVCVYMRVRV